MSMSTKSKEQVYRDALQQHAAGKSLKAIMQDNPEVRRSTFYSFKKQAAAPDPSPMGDATASISKETAVESETVAAKPKPSITPRFREVDDSFLNQMRPGLFEDQGSRGRDAIVGSLMSGSGGGGGGNKEALMDSMFGGSDLSLFQPEQLRAAPYKSSDDNAVKGSSILGKGKSWWLNGKTKERRTPEQERNEEQMVTVQKIRLYLMHFPQLEELHIIPRKKSKGHEGEPDTEKWLVSLYGKKQEELNKTLDFIRFHVRNAINEQTSIKMANNVVTTGSKVLEHVLVALGLKVQGLTDSLMADADVERCIREILIENSISTFSYGAKADLGLKLMMKIVSTDSHNRIEERVRENAEKKAKEIEKKEKEDAPKPIPTELQSKYSDL